MLMADDNFRSDRNRDPAAPSGAGSSARAPMDDPLAELARLIGQSDPAREPGRSARPGPSYDDRARDDGLDWAADNRYAERAPPPVSERYETPRLAESYPSYSAGPA